MDGRGPECEGFTRDGGEGGGEGESTHFGRYCGGIDTLLVVVLLKTGLVGLARYIAGYLSEFMRSIHKEGYMLSDNWVELSVGEITMWLV